MKKLKQMRFFYVSSFILVMMILGIVGFIFNMGNQQVKAADQNYFLIGKNNFTDSNISKGLLDNKVSQIAVPREPEDIFLTYNQLYVKYNFGPEMTNYNSNKYDFNPYNIGANSGLIQYDENANAIKENGVQLLYEQTPADKVILGDVLQETSKVNNAPNVPDSFPTISNAGYAIKPLMFSYLYVGDGVTGQNNHYTYTKAALFPDSINYNENNKMSDYMLSEANKVVIPLRYNEQRNDVTLLMRSKTEAQINTPQVHLEVKDENGVDVPGKDASPKMFIQTTLSFHILPFSFNHLSTLGKIRFKQFITENGITTDVAGFNETMNTGLKKMRTYSSEGIVQGSGGGVSLDGFYRDGLEDYEATEAQRYDDDMHVMDVKYYMLQDEPIFMRSNVVDKTKSWSDAALADKVDGISNVLSPEVIKFKIKATRPTINSKVTTTTYDAETSVFDTALGYGSLLVEDQGIDKFANAAGGAEKIPVDIKNIRVRVKEGTGDWSAPMKMDDFEANMASYAGKKINILYTYAATDAEKENIDLLPEDIQDNTGAYAIPLLRTVEIAALKSTITVKHVIKGTDTLLNNAPITSTQEVGDSYTHIAPETYEKGGKTYKLVTYPDILQTTFTVEDQVFVFEYEEVQAPVQKQGDITVTYVVKDGPVLYTKKTTKEVGSKFTHTAPATYKKDGKTYELVTEPAKVTGTYKETEQEFIYEYKEVVTPEKVKGDITVKYVVKNGPVLYTKKTTKEAGSKFTHTAPATYKKDGKTYELVTEPAKVTGTYKKESQEFVYVYKEKKATVGTVTVRYVDEDGTVLKKMDAMSGKVGGNYTTSAPAFYEKDGKKYKRVSVPSNAKGTYRAGNTNVDYVYKEVKESTPVPPTVSKPDGTTGDGSQSPSVNEPTIQDDGLSIGNDSNVNKGSTIEDELIVDDARQPLPQTGTNEMFSWTLVGTGILLLVGATWLFYRKKKLLNK